MKILEDIESVDRRGFMAYMSALGLGGTVFPGVLWAHMQARGEITSEMLEVMINSRHQEALRRAGGSLQIAREQLRAGTPLDLVAVDLRIGTNAVGEIVGRTTTEDLLDSIFSTFCIGK